MKKRQLNKRDASLAAVSRVYREKNDCLRIVKKVGRKGLFLILNPLSGLFWLNLPA